MNDRPHHRARDFLYGDPGRAVPHLATAFGVAVALLSRSPGLGALAWLSGRKAWSCLSARLVIEDPRLGPVTLNCPARSPRGRQQLWLTFDDGPGPDTEAVLDILEKHAAPATFFMIGERAAAYRDPDGLARRLRQGGHRVANHSFHHPNFLTLEPAAVRDEIDSTHDLLDALFGDLLLPLFRPPFGYRDERLFAHTQSRGLEVMGWSVNSLDFLDGSTQALVSRVDRLAEGGAILLFHDGPSQRSRTVRSLPGLLTRLEERGFEFTVPGQEDLS